MFSVGSATRIQVAAGSTDMRKGFEGLFGLVRDRLACNPLSGHVIPTRECATGSCDIVHLISEARQRKSAFEKGHTGTSLRSISRIIAI